MRSHANVDLLYLPLFNGHELHNPTKKTKNPLKKASGGGGYNQ